MPTQPGSASAQAESVNPMLEMIRMMAILDPHPMIAVMQKLIPFATAIPGLDVARLAEIQEEYFSAISNASTNIKKILSDTAAEEYRMLQECVSETSQRISCASAPTSMAAKQTEAVEHLMDKLSSDTIRLMQRNSEHTIAIMMDMRRHYIDALKETMQLIQPHST